MSRFSDRIQLVRKNILDTVKHFKGDIDGAIEKANKERQIAEAEYNESVLPSKIAIIKSAAQGTREAAMTVAKIALVADCQELEDILREWLVTPLPEVFSGLVSAYRTFDMPMTHAELEILSAASAGSYFGSKVLAGFAERLGLYFPFVSIENIRHEIRIAKGEVFTAIDAYRGKTDRGRIPGAWIFDPVEVYRADAADRFGRDDRQPGAFERTFDMLESIMSEDYSLLPSDKDRIAALFDGTDDEYSKVQRMVELLKYRPDIKSIEDQLIMFDSDAYEKAAMKIRDEALADLAQHKADGAEAQREHTEAVLQAAKDAAAADRMIKAAKATA